MKQLIIALVLLGSVVSVPAIAAAAGHCCSNAPCCKDAADCCK
jgi:hypothetical protein